MKADAWIRRLIHVGAGVFIAALILSAVFDPSIRILHLLQAVIYVAVIILAKRKSAWGYGAGFFISFFWNYVNLFLTNFIAAGWEQFAGLLKTGRLDQPDLAVALIAAGGHCLLIGGCLAGFLRQGPKLPDWARFGGGGVLAMLYFGAIVVAAGPQFLGLFGKALGR